MIIDKFSFIPINITLMTYLLFYGVIVPHYCYHEELSLTENCRMCVVEVEKAPKPVVSCIADAFLLIKENSIFPNSVFVQKARENILEFLLVNHPLDCPVCDQGGDCGLQDQALYFGLTKRRFYAYKRVVGDIDLGLTVKTHFTRCIHCTRCVRFIKEVAGVGELGMLGRGVFSEAGTFIEKVLTTELASNIIGLCPVARALIYKIIIHICSRPAGCAKKAWFPYEQ